MNTYKSRKAVYSRKGTMAMRKLFGNVLEKVFVVIQSDYMKAPGSSLKKAQGLAECQWWEADKTWLEMNTDEIILVFTNGRKVSMQPSEWLVLERIHEVQEHKEFNPELY